MVRLTLESSDQAWDAALATLPGATLYHTMGWLRVYKESFGYELAPLAILQDDHRVGLFPVYVTKKAGFRVASSPRGVDTLYLGPLMPPELLGEFLDAYEAWARAGRVDFTSIAFTGEIDAAVAEWRGFECQRHKTHVVNLEGGEERVFEACERNVRKAVRKARRLGVKIIEGGLEEHLDRYLEWSASIFAKSSLETPLTRPFIEGLLRYLSQTSRLIALRAEVEGHLVGMYIAGHYRGTLHAIDIVSDKAYSQYAVNTLLYWEAISRAIQKGITALDFAGANTASIAAYKACFGGTVKYYSNITKAHSSAVRAALWFRSRVVGGIRGLVSRHTQEGRALPKVPAETSQGADNAD
jgi:CelD/BcsL family acetyltransferase involved in cellulose biosynthesis